MTCELSDAACRQELKKYLYKQTKQTRLTEFKGLYVKVMEKLQTHIFILEDKDVLMRERMS